MSHGAGPAFEVEKSCAFLAVSFSDGRREKARLVSGEQRSFGLNADRNVINVPYPVLAPDWTPRSLTCGIALQCAPTKDQLAKLDLNELSPREYRALIHIEGEVAYAWVASRWPGLLPELRRLLPGFRMNTTQPDNDSMIDLALALARSKNLLACPPILGQLPPTKSQDKSFIAALKRMYGQMPWSTKRKLSPAMHTIPVAGDGGIKNPNLPPASRPEDEEVEICPDQRAGIPYPEWNMWTKTFMRNHVAVLERHYSHQPRRTTTTSVNLRSWFAEHTHRAMKNNLDDGAELDTDRYISHFLDCKTGMAPEPRIFRDLVPSVRDVSTAVLLDGSSSLGAHRGRIFQLELACADALSHAMSLAKEKHGLFVFSGNTRHRVDVACLKDFNEPRRIVPSDLGLTVGGYTRLGAPIRHLTNRLLRQPSERRLLIIIGDGLISDEGYEGHYAWADVAHSVEEAVDAGLAVYYIGVGPTRVDPLPEVFGPKRSTRIKRVEELPRVLAQVHRELVAA